MVSGVRVRARRRLPIEWLAAVAFAALLGVGGGRYLRASDVVVPAVPATDAAVVTALGAPSGILAVVNPVNCSFMSRDAAALNALAAIPGMRVTVLLLAVPARDSVLRQVRRDFGFSPAVVVASAGGVNPAVLPELLRQPFVAMVVRGRLRHAAWGESLKAIHAWLPLLAKTQASPLTDSPS